MKKEEIKKPVCPCGKEMAIHQYLGYYEAFNYWDCECSFVDKNEPENIIKGCYA